MCTTTMGMKTDCCQTANQKYDIMRQGCVLESTSRQILRDTYLLILTGIR